MAEINAGLTIKSVSERMLVPIESLGESRRESMSADILKFVERVPAARTVSEAR